MIKIKDKKVNVQFSKTELGNMCIGIDILGQRMYLQEIINDGNTKIGDSVKNEDIVDLPIVNMDFSRIESIDTMIKLLITLRDGMIKQRQFAMAC